MGGRPSRSPPIRTEQPRYSVLTRTIEGTVLPVAQRHGMGVLSYGPRAADGCRTGPSHPGPSDDQRSPGIRPECPGQPGQAGGRPCAQRSRRRGRTPATHLATAFVRSHPAVTSVIIGPRTPEQLDDLLAGANVALSDGLLDRIDEIVPPGRSSIPTTTISPPRPHLRIRGFAAAEVGRPHFPFPVWDCRLPGFTLEGGMHLHIPILCP